MRRLLWLGAIISAFLLSSCGVQEKRAASPQDTISNEEYRIMSAVLKDLVDEREEYQPFLLPEEIPIDRGESLKVSRQIAAEKAKTDSLHRRFDRLGKYIHKDTSHPAEFFDTLIVRFGWMAYYILRDSVNGKIAYDSLHRKYGNLSYYVTVWKDTKAPYQEAAPEFSEKEAAKKLTPDLIQSFGTANLVKYKLDRDHFSDLLIVDLISEGEFDSTLSHRDWWPAFYKRYPLSDGTIGLSRVGFNSDTTTAVIYLQVASGRFGGDEIHYLLEKRGGKWKIICRDKSCIM
ncbi:MAG: hypothetical protein NT028_07920 [candidate division Zixibacteria bacterium]|nr:hypothetical protein [candidate division Zixibacteria bacterium]